MDLGIKGLRVLVTAGANGIGREVARAFVEEGAKVHICDVDREAIAELARTDPTITSSSCDVADRKQVADLFATAVDRLGGLDVLVNNAGIAGPTGRVEEINPEDWDRCIEVCLTSQFNCARLAVPHLKNSTNASIINLASVAGRFGFALRTPYAAAKWGVEGDRIRRVLEAKAQSRGISFREIEQQASSYTSLKTFVTPRQLADQMLLLASPRGKTISGQALSICGDMQMLT